MTSCFLFAVLCCVCAVCCVDSRENENENENEMMMMMDAAVTMQSGDQYNASLQMDDDDDWLLRKTMQLFSSNGNHTPITWTKSTYLSINDVEYIPLDRVDGVFELKEKLLRLFTITASISTAKRVIVVLTVLGWCGLLRYAEEIKLPEYSAMFLLNTNVGLLSDDPWFPNQNLTVDERLDICSSATGTAITRRHILQWLNTEELKALWVNQRTFQAHWKVHVIPIGIGPSHYEILLNRYGVGDIFAHLSGLLQQQHKTQRRTRPNLLGVNHSWECGREAIFKVVNGNFGASLENSSCDLEEGESEPSEDEMAECVRGYRDMLTSSRFCLSPRGLGSDCYRHWEALLCGCIPVMESGPLNKMFEGLPVVVVDDWSKVTPQLLQTKWEEYRREGKGNGYNIEKLTLEYYVDKVRQAATVEQTML